MSLPTFRQRPKDAPVWSVTQGIVQNYHNMPPFESIDDAFLRRYLQAYLACISYVDACVGRVLAALEASGHADHTIVVFMGDHGYQMGECDSWGHKHSNFEISTRTPLLIFAPEMKSAGTATRQLTEFLDLYPTLCELAGLTPPDHLAGNSFARLLDDPTASHRDAACSEMIHGKRIGRSIRTNSFRYTEWRDEHERLVARELYNHRDDHVAGSRETVNVADQPEFAETITHLSERLGQLVPHQKPPPVHDQ